MSRLDHEDRPGLNRREALKLSAAAGFAAAFTPSAKASDSIKTGEHQQEPPFYSTPRSAIAVPSKGNPRAF